MPALTSLRDVRDGALLVDFPGRSEEEANRAAVAVAARLLRDSGRGLLDAVPGAHTLLVVFEPSRVPRERFAAQIESAAVRMELRPDPGRLIRISVAYGGEDLAGLARGAGLSEEEFARRHAAAAYRVAFLGFAPGFPYLTGLPEDLSAPRLSSPRTRVPSGSVAIGGAYCGVYPAAMPGGWRLIGRTGASLFDPAADPPALLAAGDRVRFEAVAADSLPEPRPAARPEPAGRLLFRVFSPGAFTSIQGAPRWGLSSSGVPAGGAMDQRSLARANALAGNAAGAPALEATLVGPELEALAPVTVAVAGASASVERDGRAVPVGEAFALEPGQRLRLGRIGGGARVYLAVAGGLEPDGRVGGTASRLERGDAVGAPPEPLAPARARATPRLGSSGPELRVIVGPQAEHFAPAALNRFLASPWTVSGQSDRRGLRLDGEPLERARAPEILPEGTLFGSVQVPGSGLPIVLGPDGPATGGYPKIATVIEADLPLLGQAVPGTTLRFQAVSLDEALEAR